MTFNLPAATPSRLQGRRHIKVHGMLLESIRFLRLDLVDDELSQLAMRRNIEAVAAGAFFRTLGLAGETFAVELETAGLATGAAGEGRRPDSGGLLGVKK